MGAVTVYQQPQARRLMVKGLRPGLTEVGKIKIGMKGEVKKSRAGNEFQQPVKLDHFRVTTLERGADGNFLLDEHVHSPDMYGPTPRELPIRLLFNDPYLSFQTSYTAYWGKTRWCVGNGENAQRLQKDGSFKEVTCPCPNLEPDFEGNGKCKINGKLSVLVDGANSVGGVWVLRTTSRNTCESIWNSLMWLTAATGGQIANIPLLLTIRPQQATLPDGSASTIYVVRVGFRGTFEELRTQAEQRAIADLQFGHRMREIEGQVLALTAPPGVGETDPDEETDTGAEFYPDAAGPALVKEANGNGAAKTNGNGAGKPASQAKVEPETKPAAAETVQLWGADLDEYRIAAGEAAKWLADQLQEINDLETLDEFLKGNEDRLNAQHLDAASAIRRQLEAYQGGANETVDPETGEVTETKPADPPQQDQQQEELLPEATAAGDEIVVTWPGNGKVDRYGKADFMTAYQRRKKVGPPHFEAQFAQLNPNVYRDVVQAA